MGYWTELKTVNFARCGLLGACIEIVFVNNGGIDNTLEILKDKAQECDVVRVINLLRNFRYKRKVFLQH